MQPLKLLSITNRITRLIIFILSGMFLLISCSDNKEKLLEKCADQKTASYWHGRSVEFQNEIRNYQNRYNKSVDKYEKKSIELAINEKKYYYNLYNEASKKNLKSKLYEFPSYENNYNTCKLSYALNPDLFKKTYK